MFSKIFSLAALARLRFIPHLEMKTCGVFNQLHIFGGIIIPKFTENTHKIAQNCVYNVRKLIAGGGCRKKGGRENG